MFCFVLLKLMWLKFLIIWRFFRLWALLDGIETPENMSRWMTDNYTLKGFWRGWHCSFNRWLVRYIYVPLGGSGSGSGSGGGNSKSKSNGNGKSSAWLRLRNIFCVFTFVALWHDMTMQLLLWGWLSAIAFAPEAFVQWLASRPAVLACTHPSAGGGGGANSGGSGSGGEVWWLGNLTALLGALNVLLLIVANMIGFATAASGSAAILSIALASRDGLLLLAGATIMLYNGVIVMVEIRAAEAILAAARRSKAGRESGRSPSPSPAPRRSRSSSRKKAA